MTRPALLQNRATTRRRSLSLRADAGGAGNIHQRDADPRYFLSLFIRTRSAENAREDRNTCTVVPVAVYVRTQGFRISEGIHK